MPAQSSEVAYVWVSSVFSLMSKRRGLMSKIPAWTSRHGESPAPTRDIVLSYALRGTEDVRMASVADVRPRVS